jgi:hypothetical protein
MENTDGAGEPGRPDSHSDVCELVTLGLRGGKEAMEEESLSISMLSVSSPGMLRCNSVLEDMVQVLAMSMGRRAQDHGSGESYIGILTLSRRRRLGWSVTCVRFQIPTDYPGVGRQEHLSSFENLRHGFQRR